MGFFGKGFGNRLADIGRGLMGAQAAIDGDFGASAALFNSVGAQQRAAQAEALKRQQDFADFIRREQYKAAHPSPVNNDTVNDYNFILQNQGQEAANQYLRNRYDPIVNIPLPGGSVYMGPRSGMAAALGGGQGSAPSAQRYTDPDTGDVYELVGSDRNDPNAWKKVGGAGLATPRPFR